MKNPVLTKQIQKDKAPKGEIRFGVILNEEQKEAKRIILENVVTVLVGFAGSGKTLLACQVGLDMLFKKQVEKLIITRPTVTSGEELGYLPGTVEEKLGPFLAPILSNMYQLCGKEKIDKLIENGTIEINALAYMRGRTFSNSFVICDEFQNATTKDFELTQGRLGLGSKMVICGDTAQIDLKYKKDSGLSFLRRIEERVPDYKFIILKTNHRHPIVELILKVYEEYRD